MLVDSHCHLDRVSLKAYDKDFSRFMAETLASGVGRMLCVAIDLEHYPKMRALVEPYPQVSVSVGVHPNDCLLYTSPSPRDGLLSRMPSSA
mgnify:CR=1 FL=1